eukprot:1972229-Alexandrium_andersonii.AAC.1
MDPVGAGGVAFVSSTRPGAMSAPATSWDSVTSGLPSQLAILLAIAAVLRRAASAAAARASA